MRQRVDYTAAIRTNLKDTIGLPDDATDWLCELWAAIQFLDDAADGDKIDRADAEKATWSLLAGLQLHPFYMRNSGTLLPLVSCQILKWVAANEAEATGQADHRSFMWRAGFYDVAAMVAHLCGCDPGQALRMYGESIADYYLEFPNA